MPVCSHMGHSTQIAGYGCQVCQTSKNSAPVAGSDLCLVVGGTHMQLMISLMTASAYSSCYFSARTRRQQSQANAHLSAAHDAAYDRAGIGYSQVVHVLASGVTHQETASQKHGNALFSHSTDPEARAKVHHIRPLCKAGRDPVSHTIKMTLNA